MSAQSTYAYRARDTSGTMLTGTMVASSADEVGAKLRADGKFVVAIEENPLRLRAQLDETQIRRNEVAKRIRKGDVIAFAQQLSVMLDTGVPLAEAMDAFRTQTPRREFREVLGVVADDLEGGELLSRALEKWPRVFPGLMVSLMKASEASGTMSTMLARVGDYMSKERRTIRQVRNALTYPTFMIVAGLSITFFLVAFILPKFAAVYEEMQARLPGITRMLLAVSDFAMTQYVWYGPAVVGLVVGAMAWARVPAGRRVLDWLRIHLPIVGPMYRHLYVTRAARTMSTLLGAGVNVLDVIDICQGVTRNVYWDQLWGAMAEDVRKGRQISDTVANSALLPANVSSMIAAGERSGRLAEVMERIAEFSQEELDNSIRSVTTFIEPAMIMIMGAILGTVAVALLYPILTMSKHLGPG